MWALQIFYEALLMESTISLAASFCNTFLGLSCCWTPNFTSIFFQLEMKLMQNLTFIVIPFHHFKVNPHISLSRSFCVLILPSLCSSSHLNFCHFKTKSLSSENLISLPTMSPYETLVKLWNRAEHATNILSRLSLTL